MICVHLFHLRSSNPSCSSGRNVIKEEESKQAYFGGHLEASRIDKLLPSYEDAARRQDKSFFLIVVIASMQRRIFGHMLLSVLSSRTTSPEKAITLHIITIF